MANRRKSMKKGKAMLKMKLSERQIGRSLSVLPTTVGKYLEKAERAGISWSEAEKMNEEELLVKLFPDDVTRATLLLPKPDMNYIYEDAEFRKGVQ